MKKLLAVLVTILVAIFSTISVFAANFSFDLTVNNGSGTTYTQYPMVASVDNTQLIADGYLEADGSDARILDGNAVLWRMLTTDKVWWVGDVAGNSIKRFQYTTGEFIGASYDSIIPGHDGYVTISDNACVELGVGGASQLWAIYLNSVNLVSLGNGIIFSKPGAVVIQMSGGNLVATVTDATAATYTCTVTPLISTDCNISLEYFGGTDELRLIWTDGTNTETDITNAPALDVDDTGDDITVFSNIVTAISAITIDGDVGFDNAVSYSSGYAPISGTTLPDNGTGGYNHDAEITFGTGLTGVASGFNVIGEKRANLIALPTQQLIDTIPGAHPNTYLEGNTSGIIGADFVNEALTTADIPEAFFWFPIVFFFAIALGFGAYALTKQLIVQAVVSALIMAVYSIGGPAGQGVLPWVVTILFVIEAAVLVIIDQRVHV
jgi:hypothetical protein